MKYEPWCKHCVKGKGLTDPHRRLKKHNNDDVPPVVSMDFALSKQEGQEGTSPVFVVRDHVTRTTLAHPLPGKPTVNEAYFQYTIDAVVRDMGVVDRKKWILNSDQEPLITELQERVKQLRCGAGEHTYLEHSPFAESQSNGVVENSVAYIDECPRKPTRSEDPMGSSASTLVH